MRRIAGFAGLAVLLFSAEAAAQDTAKQTPSAQPNTAPTQTTTLQQRLMPPAPASVDAEPRWNAERKPDLKDPLQPAPAPARGQSVALMVAGGALFVAGVLVGDDAGALLMVGGAVIGAYGLYLYFR